MAADHTDLDHRISAVLDEADRMFIATAVDGNTSGASVFFARDGDDLVFFTFHPTRKAEQIRANPRVQCAVWPRGQEGIRGLQIDGEAEVITKYVDFHADPKFEWREYPGNRTPLLQDAWRSFRKRTLLWLRAVRAPFFTAAIVPILLGGVIAWGDLESAGMGSTWHWGTFLLALLGGVLAQAAVRWGREWLDRWNAPEADRQRLPYELLKVNVSTIGVHFLTGLLLVLGYWLRGSCPFL